LLIKSQANNCLVFVNLLTWSRMHETAIVQDMFRIIDQVAEENQLKRIDRVNFVIGKMMQVVPDLFYFAFDAAKEGTIAENSEVKLEFLPIKMKCKSCGKEFLIDNNVFYCPACQNTDLDLIQGKELLIKSIEGE